MSTPYDKIKSQCLSKNKLWEDPDFPSMSSSLFYSEIKPENWKDIEWKRPHEICANPQFFVDGVNRMDVVQGELCDCWMLAALAALTSDPELFYRVVPLDQSFRKDYAGIFRFRFWQYGRWLDVLVDDYLPVSEGKLIYLKSHSGNEFWSALLEKAYAKLHGSYEALAFGYTGDALTDFTGGLVETYTLKCEAPAGLFKDMLKAYQRGALMGCLTGEENSEAGLADRHAYSVTDVRTVPTHEGQKEIIRLRNPWGQSEWKGPWGDWTPNWHLVSEEEIRSMGLTFNDDGEFWMSHQDFVSNFDLLEVCFLGPDSIEEMLNFQRKGKKWKEHLFEGSWTKDISAGGGKDHPDTSWKNPQYKVKIVDPDSDDDDGNGTIIVGLMQKDRRKQKKENLTIGYAICKVPSKQSGTLNRRFFKQHGPTSTDPKFRYSEYKPFREVSGHHKLPPGDYVIVPSTEEPNEEGDFILRIFSERKNDQAVELDDDERPTRTCFKFRK